MKNFLKDTIFTRFFGLAFAAVVVSHLMLLVLLFLFLGDQFPPRPPVFKPPAVTSHVEPRSPNKTDVLAHEKRAEFDDPMLGFALILGLQFVGLAVATWIGSRMLAKPIQRLAEAASQIGDQLNAPALAEVGPLEVRQAAIIFNKMQAKINSQLEERGRFLAAVSHDLRTPLTRMYLRLEHLDNASIKEKLQRDVEEMRRMLDATLAYLRNHSLANQRNQTGQLLDVYALVEAIVDDAREQGMAVSLQGEAQPILATPQNLRRCLNNLIENAVFYGQCAEVMLSDHSDRLLITVSDHGPGLPEDALLQVFEPFYRMTSARTSHSGGVGLGLSIAREIVRQHAGELVLFNRKDRSGLSAQITLPRQQPDQFHH